MKIIIIGTLRTRSSYLLDTLSQEYNLEDKWEPYDDLFRKKTNGMLKNLPENVWPEYKKAAQEMTEKFMQQDNFILKVFSHAFFNTVKAEWNLMRNKPFTLDKANDLLDLETHLNISKYNHIYFLTRKDYINNICSYLFGQYTNTLLYTAKERHGIKFQNRPMIVRYNKLFIQLLIIQNMFLKVFEKKLVETSLPYVKLDYDEVPNYVLSNFPNIVNKFIETKFDYKSIIKNYDEIVNVIEEEKIKFQPLIDNLLP